MFRIRLIFLVPLLGTVTAGCDADLTIASGGASTDLHVVCVRAPPAASDCTLAEVEVGPRSRLEIIFSEPVDRDSAAAALAVTSLPDGASVAGEIEFGRAGELLVFAPSPPLAGGKTYRIDFAPEVLPQSPASRARGVRLEPSGSLLGGVDLPFALETFASPPEPPAGLAVEAVSANAVRLRWSPAADNATAPEDLTYRIFAAEAPGAIDPEAPLATTQPGALTHLVVQLLPDTNYRFAVAAVDLLGNASGPSGTVEMRTPKDPSADEEPPSFAGVAEVRPPGIASSIAATELLVRWVPAADNVDPPDVIRYEVSVAPASGAQDLDEPCTAPGCLTSPPGASEIVVRDLAPDTTYFVVVRAVDSSGNRDANTVERAGTTRVSFAEGILSIFRETDPARGGGCARASCHSSPLPSGGLLLESYDGLIAGGVTMRSNPDLFPIVVPFEEISDSMRSYIIRRTDSDNIGFIPPRMPLGEPQPLSAGLLARLKRWIHQGALDN